MVLFTIRLRRTGFIREDRSLPRPGEPFLFRASGVLGGLRPSPLSVSLYSLFIVVFFLLNEAPRVGTCPISSSLQLLGVVVRTEKYDRVKRMALNVIMAAFPLNTFVVLFCFSTLPAPWDDRKCHCWWQVISPILGYNVLRRALPVAEEGLFPLDWASGPI